MKKKRNIFYCNTLWLKFHITKEEIYSKIYKRQFTFLFSKGIFQSQFSSEDIIYSLHGKQKTRLYSLQLLCNTEWRNVKMPGAILNTSKSLCLNTRKFSSPMESQWQFWKDLKRLKNFIGELECTVQWERWKQKETFRDNVLYILNPSTPWISLLILSSSCYTFLYKL